MASAPEFMQAGKKSEETADSVSVGLQQTLQVRTPPMPMMLPSTEGNNISAGSHGHPEMCHRPCVYMFKSGFCHLGSFCDHCHLPHEGPSLLKLDKKQRTKLREMCREDLIALLMPHIRHRVAANGLGAQTRELVQMLEEEAVPRRAILRDLLPREVERLNRVLSRLPFSALAAWLHGMLRV